MRSRRIVNGINSMNEKKILKCLSDQDAMIDIMVLTYNHEKYIRQALDSIFMQQSEYSYRVIIGEDCSIDHTREIVLDYYKKFPDKIEIILWKKNVGALINDMEVMKSTRAKYVASLEGDDYWTDPYKIQKQIVFLENHPEYIGTAHNVRCVDEDGCLLHRDFDYYPIRESFIYGKEQAESLKMVSQTASLVYRNVYKMWGQSEWMFYKNCGINGDLVGQVFLGMQGQIYFFRDIMADHRRVFAGDSWTAKSFNKNLLYREYANTRKLQRFLEENYCIEIKKDQLWESLWEESKKRLLCDFNLENLKVCIRLLCVREKI